jgi:hypothetical protein
MASAPAGEETRPANIVVVERPDRSLGSTMLAGASGEPRRRDH